MLRVASIGRLQVVYTDLAASRKPEFILSCNERQFFLERRFQISSILRGMQAAQMSTATGSSRSGGPPGLPTQLKNLSNRGPSVQQPNQAAAVPRASSNPRDPTSQQERNPPQSLLPSANATSGQVQSHDAPTSNTRHSVVRQNSSYGFWRRNYRFYCEIGSCNAYNFNGCLNS